MTIRPDYTSPTRPSPSSEVLLVQPVIRHPVDRDVHNPHFARYFNYMKVIAEESGFLSLVTSGELSPPTHLLSIAAYLREQNVTASVADLNLSYLSDGAEPEKKLIDKLEQIQPKVLGISAMESYVMDSVYRLVETAKNWDPELFVVLGGVNATAMDEEILQTNKVDAVVRGEGEATFFELCQAFLNRESLSSVKGISYLNDNGLVRNPDRAFMDLSKLPLPAREIYPLEKIYILNKGVDAVYASRGCPYKCLFCHSPSFWKRQWRGRNPDYVVRELDYIESKGGKVVFFYDMNFGCSKEWALNLCQQIAEAKLGLLWGCELRVESLLDRKFLEEIYHGGCRSVFVGIESMDQQSLTGVDKGYSVKELYQGLRNAVDIGINVEATVMIGMPDDTADSICYTTNEMIKLFRNGLLKLVHYFLCIPWRGTEIGNHPEKYGLNIVCRNYRHFITAPSVPIASTKYLTAEEVYSLWEKGIESLCSEVEMKLLFMNLKKVLNTERTPKE
jgi:anaerobic magnesium-protoporphyrin IX monomethyl ester cyclase